MASALNDMGNLICFPLEAKDKRVLGKLPQNCLVFTA